MLGRFSSAEVCCLNPAESERERERKGERGGEGRNREGEAERKLTIGIVKKRVVERGVFSRIRLFLSASRALCFSLMVMDGPQLGNNGTHIQ